MTVREHILVGLDELERNGRISPSTHQRLLSRIDSLIAIISDCGSLEEAAEVELCGLEEPEPSDMALKGGCQ